MRPKKLCFSFTSLFLNKNVNFYEQEKREAKSMNKKSIKNTPTKEKKAILSHKNQVQHQTKGDIIKILRQGSTRPY